MKKVLLLSLIMLLPTLLRAQAAMEEIGNFRLIYATEANTTMYQLSYKGFKGEVGGSDGEFGGRVSPNYSYVVEKTKKGTIKYWKLGFTGRCLRESNFTMNKGGKILIKLFDNSVITLIANSVDIKEDYEYGTWFLPSARLSDVNLKKITNIGVKKVRFETFPKVFDVIYENDIIGKFLKEAAPILKEKANGKTDRLKKDF